MLMKRPQGAGRSCVLSRRSRFPGTVHDSTTPAWTPRQGLLFAAHLGASEVVEINIHTGAVVRVIPGLPQVHGVLVVPALHRTYATATGINKVARINEDSGQVLGMTPTGTYPDGLAYDPVGGTIWTTNESGGSETVTDAATGAPRG